MNERTIFLAALEIADPAKQADYVNQACAGDAALLRQVEMLLAAHTKSGAFLDAPVLRQIADSPDATQAEPSARNDEVDLAYLTPSTKPGSLGTLGHYEVLQVLGQGGFGTVLKAFDEKLHRLVAIKVLSRQLAATSPPRKRFLREARAVAAIKHENVVQVYSVEEQPLPYIVMEFVDGSTLQDKMDEAGPLGVPEVLHIGRQIAAGLAAAHALGLIHRDIKPGNILLEKGVMQKVKITDFGLARTADDASLTQSGTIAGTPLYMAPEQAKGAKLDPRADLFSLGSVLYALACGHPPFRAPTTLAVLRRVAEDTPRPLPEIIPEIPDWFVAIIDKLLAKEPADRFQTAQEVADLLGLCQSQLHAGVTPTAVSLGLKPAAVEPAESSPVAPRPVAKAEPKRKKFPVAGVAAGIVLMVAVMAAGVFFLNKNKGDGNIAVAPPEKPADPPVEAVPATFKNSIGMEFVKVPKGTGWLGGGAGKQGETKVVIEQDFYLGKYEVTQEEWEAVTGLNPSHFSRTGAGKDAVKDIPDADLKRFPVENVSWDDCQLFIERLNKKEKDTGWVYRLPTEAEWEYACRGGPVDKLDSAFNHYFEKPTNVLLPEQANYTPEPGKGLQRTNKVGFYKPNALGLFDMHANVSEWSNDRLPNDAGSEVQYVLRGGGWIGDAQYFRATERYTSESGLKGHSLGLRLARVPVGPAVAVPAATADADRKAAEYVLSIGGKVGINEKSKERLIPAVGDLPPGAFELTVVDLSFNQKVSDAGLANFNDCKNLTYLALTGTQVTDAGLAHFKDCKNLALLILPGAQTTDTGIAHFKECKNLTTLGLTNTQVTNRGLIHFKDCKNLAGLDLQCTQVTDEGLAYFKDCINLTSLNLSITQTTDVGLAHFKNCKNLVALGIQKTKITAAKFEELKKALPKCRIESDYGTYDPSSTFKNTLGMEFVKVPKGTGWLGGGAGKQGETKVVIEQDFYLGKYEVTQEEWEAVTGLNPSHFSRNGAGKDAVKDIPDADLKRFPVESVSWDDCQLFIKRLNEKVKDTGWVYRLPKEAEWEYACRGPGDKLDSAFDFYFAKPTNTLLPEQANFAWAKGKGLQRTCKVGSYEPNPLGLYDMHGNVWVWCEDADKGPDGASHRVTRGGDWDFGAKDCRAASRYTNTPSLQLNRIGLRLARVPVGPAVAVPATADPDRKAAEYVLSIGGEVEVNGANKKLKAIAELPKEPFQLIVASLVGKVSDDGLAVFKDCKNLTGLYMSDSPLVSDAGLVHFKNCKNLTDLHLHRLPRISNTALANFKDCKSLSNIALTDLSIDDIGLAIFKECKGLKTLNLKGTQVTDDGLAYFGDCKNLIVITLQKTKVTEAGVKKIAASLPKCKIEFDGGVIGPKEPSVPKK